MAARSPAKTRQPLELCVATYVAFVRPFPQTLLAWSGLASRAGGTFVGCWTTGRGAGLYCSNISARSRRAMVVSPGLKWEVPLNSLRCGGCACLAGGQYWQYQGWTGRIIRQDVSRIWNTCFSQCLKIRRIPSFTEHNVISAAGLREFLQHGLPFPFNSICGISKTPCVSIDVHGAAGIAKIPGLGLLMDGVAWSPEVKTLIFAKVLLIFKVLRPILRADIWETHYVDLLHSSCARTSSVS